MPFLELMSLALRLRFQTFQELQMKLRLELSDLEIRLVGSLEICLLEMVMMEKL